MYMFWHDTLNNKKYDGDKHKMGGGDDVVQNFNTTKLEDHNKEDQNKDEEEEEEEGKEKQQKNQIQPTQKDDRTNTQQCYNLSWDCACISNDIYDDDLVPKWRVHRRLFAKSSCCCWMCVSTEPVFVKDDETDAEMFVFTLYKKYLVVAFRGTESLQDMVYDMDVRQCSVIEYKDQLKFWDVDPQIHYDIYVQQGFMYQYLSIADKMRQAIQKVLQENRGATQIVVTGHSLGGALAHLFACLDSKQIMEKHGLYNTTLITFGSPRVGNRLFTHLTRQRMEHGIIYRYVNGHDPVPTVPSPPRFWHVGFPIPLNDPVIPPGLFCIDLWYIEDHKISCYLESLKKKLFD